MPKRGLIMARLEDMVRELLSSARNGSSNLVGPDTSGALTFLNLRFPDVARWNAIIELLCEPLVLERDKRFACTHIIESPERLPSAVRERLASDIDSIGTAVSGFGMPLGSGIDVATSIALGATRGDDADAATARLASGSPQERHEAALLLGSGHRPNMQPALAALTGDTHFSVRRAAAEAVGKLAAANPSPQIGALASRLAADQGTELPNALLIGLAEQDQLISDVGAEVAQQLTQSLSARVRYRAGRLLKRNSSEETEST